MIKRSLYYKIWKEISSYPQMVFISGPRQSGKTTFTSLISKEFTNSLYFNWDIIENKKTLIENPSFYENINRKDNSTPLIILDEIHKFGGWKNYLKSIYDKHKNDYKFLISGSGRLDLFKKGGDSLAGRYLLFYLFPFTLAELAKKESSLDTFLNNPLNVNIEREDEISNIWNKLSRLSGFPDPYLSDKRTYYKMWSNNYKNQLIREDIREIAQIRKFDNIEILFSLLTSKAASPLSMDSLARDIKVSFDSIKNWLTIFENFFLIFRISPWSKKISRAISKEKKLYLYDYAGIESDAARYENMVALELWRAISNWNDSGFGTFSIHYIRNKEKEEVDFLIAYENRPILLIETKMSNTNIPKSLIKFQKVINVPAIILINQKGVYRRISNENQHILIINAEQWLAGLP